MAPKLNVAIAPLNYADIDACANISRDSFAIDPHTIVKQLGRDGYDMHDMARQGYLGNLERKNMVFVKAVDSDTGVIVGYGGWVFPRVQQDLVPWIGPADAKPEGESEEGTLTQKPETKRETDSIDRLHAMEDEDMQYFQHKLIPANDPCMIVMGLAVAPAHQSRGVGSALLQHGNAMADRLGLPIWVHSSHQAVEVYGKGGFEPVRTLDVDLDEYAPRPPRDDEPVMGEKGSGQWGHYVIKYMKREPRNAVLSMRTDSPPPKHPSLPALGPLLSQHVLTPELHLIATSRHHHLRSPALPATTSPTNHLTTSALLLQPVRFSSALTQSHDTPLPQRLASLSSPLPVDCRQHLRPETALQSLTHPQSPLYTQLHLLSSTQLAAANCAPSHARIDRGVPLQIATNHQPLRHSTRFLNWAARINHTSPYQMGIARPTPGHDGLPSTEEWMGASAEQQTRTQSKILNDRPRAGGSFPVEQSNHRSGAERHMSRNSANPDEIVFAPPRVNFSSSRTKLLDGDKAAKELEQGRFGIRSSENDRTRDSRANPLRRRGDSDFDGEGWSTVKPRKSFGADGAERFSGKMGGNYRDEVKSSDRDGNRDRQSKTSDAFGRDKDRDADGRTRNGLARKMEPWNKSETNADGAAPERRDRDRTRSWRDRDQEASADNRGGDRRWGRDREQRAERDPEWFDEPAKEQRDVHTQQDFQKWMEQMKAAKNAQENQNAEEPEPEKPVKSAPAVEQGPDKFFMAFGGGTTTIDSNPPTEQTEGASKPRPAGKSSRFTSFFGGGQEEPRQRTESSTPATAAPSVPPGFAHLFGGMAPAGGRGGSAGPEDEKQAFAQLLAKLQKQTVSATPPGLSLFSPPQQNPGDGSKKSAVASPEPYQQYGNERREGPSARPQQQEIHAPRPQQQTARPDQLLQDLVGQHQRASSQSSSQRDPTMTKNNSNAEFLMNLMRAGPPNTQRAEQLQNMMAHGGPLQQKPSSMSPMNERDAHAHQQQGRPGPPPGFPALDDAFRSPDPESRPNPTQILQRPPPPPGLDHMPPNWMHGPLPPGVGPPPGQRGAGGPMMAPPGLPGGHHSRSMPMPHMFPPNFPPGAMPPPPPPEMRGSMHMPPPGFFNGPPPPHGFGLPPGMPGFNGPPPPDLRAFGSPPFDGRGMAPPSSAEAGRNGGNYGRQ